MPGTKALKLATASPAKPGRAEMISQAEHEATRAPKPPSRLGIAGYLLHGVVFGSLAIIALVHFGYVFLFVSTLIGGISLFSLYQAFAMIAGYKRGARRPTP